MATANWFDRFKKRSVLIAVVSFAAGGLTAFLGIASSALSLSDRLGWTKPEALVFAENSARSALSDELSQMAGRRLFLANLFTYRVEDRASAADIDSAWNQYVDADTSWNANLLKYIVGLSRWYGEKKSQQFEGPVQDQFAKLDTNLRAIRSSAYVRALRTGDPGTLSAPTDLFEREHSLHDETQTVMYYFVRCTAPPGQQVPSQLTCDGE